MSPIRPPVPPKPPHLIGTSSSAPTSPTSSRRGSMAEIVGLRPAASLETLTFESITLESPSQALSAFLAKHEAYINEQNPNVKSQIYNELVVLAAHVKAQDITVNSLKERRVVIRMMYAASKIEFTKVRAEFAIVRASNDAPPSPPSAPVSPVLQAIRDAVSPAQEQPAPAPPQAPAEQVQAPMPLPSPQAPVADDAPTTPSSPTAPPVQPLSPPAIVFDPASIAPPPAQPGPSQAVASPPAATAAFSLPPAQLQQLLDSAVPSELGVKQISFSDPEGVSYTQFYLNDLLIGDYSSLSKTFNPKQAAGAEKYLAILSETTAIIETKPGKSTTRRLSLAQRKDRLELTKRTNQIFTELKPQLNATCLNFVVDNKGKIVTQNGGQVLHGFLNEVDDQGEDLNNKVACASFKDAAADLALLHEKRMHHLDIKPENLSLKDGKIFIIDTDGISTTPTREQLADARELKLLKNVVYPPLTGFYMPSTFQSQIADAYTRGTDVDAQMRIRTAADNFSFLMSMMEATQGDFFLTNFNEQLGDYEPRGGGLRAEKLRLNNSDGTQEEEQESEIERAAAWAQIYIKPEYRESFVSFMQDPRRYSARPYSNSGNQELVILNIINWDAQAPTE